MAMTSKVAVAALLVASLTAGCGASAEEKETACWAKREALVAEIAAVPRLRADALKAAYGTTGKSYSRAAEAEDVQNRLAGKLPDC